MKCLRAAAGLLVGVWLAAGARAEWKPAAGPLRTRWAREVTPANVHPEYPRPQMVRKDWLNLNGLWQLAFARTGEAPPVGRELAERILVPFPVESALSGVMRHGDRLWYRRTFAVPTGWAGRRVLLHFGAVDWEATVWVNGRRLGSHRGGYDPFTFEITDALKGDGAQEVVVGVWDPTDAGTQPRGKQVLRPGGIYYTPTTGIWQTVWLEPVPEASIDGLDLTPDVDAGLVRVRARVRGQHAAATVRAEAREGGRAVAAAEGPAGQAVAVPLKGARLWSPESPFLYDLRVELRVKGGVLDAVDGYVGMRKVALGRDARGVTRILLNGKPLFQAGPLDQGFWPDGLYTAPTDAALRYDIEMTRRLGFNMTRKHVKVEPDRWYYWCDRLGLLVWQDMPSGDRDIGPGKGEITRTPESARQYEGELRAMIAARRNHPCVMMWVVFNEGWGQFDTARIVALARREDPTRLVNDASGWNDVAGVGDVHDIHVYPGPGAPPSEASRAGVLGEFGGLGLGVDGHTWSNKTWGYRGTASREDLTRKYERLWRKVWELHERQGLSAAVYTQITDVETEANGLLTYDREVVKVDVDRAAAAARGAFAARPATRVLVPTSQEQGQPWRYTTDRPAAGWERPDFDDAGWKEGPGGLGTRGTPGAVVRTEWKTSDVWARRSFTLARAPAGAVYLSLHHDEDAEVYVNGVLAARVAGYTTEYEELPLRPAARAALRAGRNVIAVHCHQTTGGQYIDVGLEEVAGGP